jgi:hypothetical protein
MQHPKHYPNYLIFNGIPARGQYALYLGYIPMVVLEQSWWFSTSRWLPAIKRHVAARAGRDIIEATIEHVTIRNHLRRSGIARRRLRS